MALRSLALATLLLIGTASPARADTTVYTPLAEAGAGSLIRCDALNAGKKSVRFTVEAVDPDGNQISLLSCGDSAPGAACSSPVQGPIVAYCRITHDGNKKTSLGTLQVRDANGNSVLNLEAR